MEPHKKGDPTEAAVLTELKRREIPVSIPFGDNERYDMLLEAPDRDLFRAQVKTGSTTDGAVLFRGYSQHNNADGSIYKKYDGDVDCFLVYTHEYERLFFVHESEVGMNMTIRIEPPQQEHEDMNWCSDFDFDERWPPKHGKSYPNRTTGDPSMSELILELIERDIPHVRSPDTPHDLVAVGPNGTRFRVCTRFGSIQNGRLRFNTDVASSNVDVYCVYASGLDNLYRVPDDAFDRSISLRVEEPAQADASISWASEYRFGKRWPPEA